jgi:hypothetical protein
MIGLGAIIGTGLHTPARVQEWQDRMTRALSAPDRNASLLASTPGGLVWAVRSTDGCPAPFQARVYEDGMVIGLYGTIHAPDARPSSALDQIRSCYLKDGPAGFAQLNGSFGFVLFDATATKHFVVVDRFASRPILYLQKDDLVFVSPVQKAFLDLNEADSKLDLKSAAAMLGCSHLHTDHTWISNAKLLRGGTALCVDANRVEPIRYWDYTIEPVEEQGETWHVQMLSELLVQSVARRLQGESRPLLLLSGGMDSRAILAACLKLGARVELCAYFRREQAASDVEVASRLAKTVGWPLRILRYDWADLMSCIKATTPFSDGMRGPIYEYEALKQLRGEYSCVLLGDHAMGSSGHALVDEEDILARSGIFWMSRAPIWRQLLTREGWELLAEADSQMFSELIAETQFTDAHDRKDFFRAVERLGRNLLPGRMYLNAQVADVRQPWLDNEILDFMAAVPRHYRLNKSLLKKTAMALAPSLFKIPLALNCGDYTELASYRLALNFNPRLIEQACLEGHAPIDALLNRDACVQYLQSPRPRWSESAADWVRNSNWTALRRAGKRLLSHLKKSSASLATSLERRDGLSPRRLLENLALTRWMTGERLQLHL